MLFAPFYFVGKDKTNFRLLMNYFGTGFTNEKNRSFSAFHTQYSTIPSFHTAQQENGRKKHCDSNKL
jgi:hypothetical protein